MIKRSKKLTNSIIVSMGQDEHFTEYLCVDLCVNGKRFSVNESGAIDDSISEENFNKYLGDALNDAKLLSTLGLEIIVEESVIDFAQEISEEFSKEVRKFIDDVLKEK